MKITISDFIYLLLFLVKSLLEILETSITRLMLPAYGKEFTDSQAQNLRFIFEQKVVILWGNRDVNTKYTMLEQTYNIVPDTFLFDDTLEQLSHGQKNHSRKRMNVRPH